MDIINDTTDNTLQNQTSTQFQYGSTQDTYIIFAMAMSVDAYIPDIEAFVSAESINGIPVGASPITVLPGQDLEYMVEIKNQGTEAINNAVITIPLLSGGLTNSGNTTTSGAVIVRRVTVQNPSGSIASANVSIGSTNDGANLVTANTVLSSVSAGGKFQDITSTATTTVISGNVTQCLYVNVNTASGNNNTVDIIVWGDVVNF
jgi:uncharacterized repeat protein (TIGR01451 family)